MVLVEMSRALALRSEEKLSWYGHHVQLSTAMGVPRIDCTASALYCSPTGRRLIVRINFTPDAVPIMFSSVASERPSHTPLLQGLRALFARDAGELSRNSTYSPNSTNGRVYSTP